MFGIAGNVSLRILNYRDMLREAVVVLEVQDTIAASQAAHQPPELLPTPNREWLVRKKKRNKNEVIGHVGKHQKSFEWVNRLGQPNI